MLSKKEKRQTNKQQQQQNTTDYSGIDPPPCLFQILVIKYDRGDKFQLSPGRKLAVNTGQRSRMVLFLESKCFQALCLPAGNVLYHRHHQEQKETTVNCDYKLRPTHVTENK